MTYHIKIIHPSACSHPGVLEANIAKLDKLECVFDVSKDFDASHWPYSSQNVERRLKEITAAMQDDQYSVIFAGRGGYGVSDLLPFIDWTTLKKHKPKVIVGFSDISALLVSVYHFLGWPCLHAPMPGTNTWNHEGADVKRLLSLITSDAKSWNGVLTLENFSNSIIDGELFGGCFSVLTNLIGTPYLNIPSKDWILFIEDLNENPGRLMRFWNQWQQSGNLKNLKAIVVGQLLAKDQKFPKQMFLDELSRRSKVPVFSSEAFGHASLNMPLMIGSRAKIMNDSLEWSSNEIK